VIGLVGSEKKADFVRSLGAHDVWTTDRWMQSKPMELGGFDAILDSSGGPFLKHGFKYLNAMGRVVNFGMSSTVGKGFAAMRLLRFVTQMPLYTPIKLMMGNKGVFGLNMLQLATDPKVMTTAFDSVLKKLEDRRYKVILGKTFPLEQAGEAHEHLMSRGNLGKIVLTH